MPRTKNVISDSKGVRAQMLFPHKTYSMGVARKAYSPFRKHEEGASINHNLKFLKTL